MLLFVVDAAGSEGRDPVQDLQNLQKEIELCVHYCVWCSVFTHCSDETLNTHMCRYSPELLWRSHAVVANKIDLISQQQSRESHNLARGSM